MIKIRRSHDRFIFIMEIPIAGKTVFILRRGPDLVIKGVYLLLRGTQFYFAMFCFILFMSVSMTQIFWILMNSTCTNLNSTQQKVNHAHYSFFIEVEWRIEVYESANWVIIGSDDGLWPLRCQAIIWTNVGVLWIGLWGTNFSEIGIKIRRYLFKKIHLKMSSAKFRLGLHALSVHVCFCMPLFYDPS